MGFSFSIFFKDDSMCIIYIYINIYIYIHIYTVDRSIQKIHIMNLVNRCRPTTHPRFVSQSSSAQLRTRGGQFCFFLEDLIQCGAPMPPR